MRADKRAYHRLMTGIEWHKRKGTKEFRFLTLTGIASTYRQIFDKFRRLIRKEFGAFEYFATRTHEGSDGVLHLLYVGKYMDYEYLKEKWEAITGHWTISISQVKDFQWQGFEMTRQQLTARYSWSKGWLPEGIPQLWKEFKAQYKGIPHTEPARAYDFDHWHEIVRNHSPSKQMTIASPL